MGIMNHALCGFSSTNFLGRTTPTQFNNPYTVQQPLHSSTTPTQFNNPYTVLGGGFINFVKKNLH